MRFIKNFVSIFIPYLLSTIYYLLFTNIAFCESYQKISCVLHVHSEFSGSKYKIEDIVGLAKENSIDCVVLTDHFLQKVEFGIWPFRKIFKKSVNLNSVMKIGAKKYLEQIDKLNRSQSNLILIPSVEITPHYFWETEDDSLVIKNLHKHMLVVNLDNEKLYYQLPVVGNQVNAGRFNIFSLWPILLLFVGILLRSKFLILLSIIFLAINFPYKYLPFDEYKDNGELPYQNLINYIYRSTDKVIIWAHPEAPNFEKKYLLKTIKKLKIYTQTLPYFESLLKTYNYDGFSIFAEGYRKVGNIGGIWDKVLVEYCEGKREKPVWCYSEVDFGETSDPIYVRKNIVYVKEKSKENIVSALKNGNFYALWRDKDKELVLENFKFCGEEVLFGETYNKNVDNIKIEFEVKFNNNSLLPLKVFVIRNGEVVFKKEGVAFLNVCFEEKKPNKKSYYRIFIESNYPNMLATNPIFVE